MLKFIIPFISLALVAAILFLLIVAEFALANPRPGMERARYGRRYNALFVKGHFSPEGLRYRALAIKISRVVVVLLEIWIVAFILAVQKQR